LTTSKLLIVNADDFGFTADVNEGIIEAHRRGIVTSATLMANGEAFEHAVRLAQQTPSLDLGAHLTLVGGYSVAQPGIPLPASPKGLALALMAGRLHLYQECAAQIRKILDAGLRLTHLDTHKHAHLLPPVAEAVGRVSREFGIPWVRRPLEAPLAGWLARRRLRKHGCRMADHLAGFAETGRLDEDRLLKLVRRIPAGLTELLCHPGYCRSELRASPATRLRESRELELVALTSPAVRQRLEECNVRLVDFCSVETALGSGSVPD